MGATRLFLAGLAVAGLLSPAVPAAAGAAATPAWSLVPSPDAMAPQGRLSSVSCASPAACMAVGSSDGRVLAERWNGMRWIIQRLPRPAEALISLSSVWCTSARACTAVGNYSTAPATFFPLAERWNGSRWAIQPMPKPGTFSYLLGVSCASANACTAVGLTRAFPVLATLAVRWNGTRWAIQRTPNTTGYDQLNAVSCPSASACTAVGSASPGGHTIRTLAERWNGTAWRVTAAPSPTRQAALSAVSCSSATACTATGYSTGGVQNTLAERWNGAAWAIQPTPALAGISVLSGVSCPSATACTAVGFHGNSQSTSEATLAEAWNGTSWAVQPTRRPAHRQLMSLAGVSCTSAKACTAAGSNGAGAGVTLAETWNGQAWTAQRTPSPIGPEPSTLTGISCTSAVACTAVGNATDNPLNLGDVTLAERWNGSQWKVEPTPRVPGAVTGYLAKRSLSAVSCTSASACTAVGYYLAQGPGHIVGAGLAERWNGTRWAVQPLPSSARSGTLTGVSCTSATSCTAVGFYLIKSRVPYLFRAEHWNGTRWAVRPAPNPPGSVTVTGVSCTSASACTAVGSYESGDNQFTLAERWNGTSWAIQATPNPAGSLQSYLTGVSCTSATACTAVGFASGNKTGVVDVTLAERWNGTSWSIQPTPDTADAVNQLRAVSCTSATSCAAVGQANYTVPLAETWNGTTWAIQGTAAPSSGAGSLFFPAVSCLPAGPCTGVGGYNGRTLVERRP